ncbi:tetratricopeptide repeat protein [Haliscomenobacter hydrossis]|uniref:Tetratricopeptide TPR_1 repeat-containing protein n=1 Tax=Haliscomenobacter hydrossis (strain ATCC 27775 / DSM 1100 / LMG 10767 / O) TaxID=760192 RepID=F4KT72_HALH1|nr:tetratricopeptide repeat protein [Haliscomenobacter hydrossis]AEE51129.1 Tetratricopeptide TPR_1 repeat-containing protein [Haliscomenobacter hydrossis DSM 1100]
MGLFDNLFGRKTNSEKINILGREYEANPDAMLYSQLGLDKYQLQDYVGSVIEFTKAINAQPSNQNFYLMRGTAYEDLGDDDSAEKDFCKTLEMMPNESIAAYRLGMVYYRKKNLDNAIKWLKIAFSNSSDLNLGMLKNNIIFVHKKVIAGNLGNFLIQQKKYEEGIQYLDYAIKLDSNYANPYMNKGIALAAIGQREEGTKYIKKAAELGETKAPAALHILNGILSGGVNSHQPNPLNIVDDPEMNRMHKLPNLIEDFANDIYNNYLIMAEQQGIMSLDQLIKLIAYYSIDLLIEYRNTPINILPSSIVENVKLQVLQAAQINFDIFNKPEVKNMLFDMIDKKIWDEDIVQETHSYMLRFE